MEKVEFNFPIRLELVAEGVRVDGVMVAYGVIPHLINALVHPDPRRWLRFERVGDTVQVYVRLSEGERNGTRTGSIGDEERQETVGSSGQEAAHP